MQDSPHFAGKTEASEAGLGGGIPGLDVGAEGLGREGREALERRSLTGDMEGQLLSSSPMGRKHFLSHFPFPSWEIVLLLLPELSGHLPSLW